MARKKKARASEKKAKRTAAKRKPAARRKPPKKKPAKKKRPGQALRPVSQDVLAGGIYAGDPTTGQISTPPTP